MNIAGKQGCQRRHQNGEVIAERRARSNAALDKQRFLQPSANTVG
jgi:hypothetical protein